MITLENKKKERRVKEIQQRLDDMRSRYKSSSPAYQKLMEWRAVQLKDELKELER